MTSILLTDALLHTGDLALVNADHPIQTEPPQILRAALPEFPDILMEQESADLLQLLFAENNLHGKIVPVSGYRSEEEQTEIYNNSLRENGAEFTRKFVALPQCSEHQTGLAIDLGVKQDEIDFICPHFPYEGVSELFRQAAPHFGFVQRYPKEKENVTGIAHEPWHFRYVGRPHAEIMTKRGFVLEEYIDFIRHFRYKKNPYHVYSGNQEVWISFVELARNQMTLTVDSRQSFSISGNNVNGWILTQWGEPI